MLKVVMPDLIRHPVQSWIPAFAGMTVLTYTVAGVIIGALSPYYLKRRRQKPPSLLFRVLLRMLAPG
jgi:hypothetical protein